MMDTLKKVLKNKNLELNTEKTKVLVFNRNRKERIDKWKWENRELEEVKTFKYLGFILKMILGEDGCYLGI